MSIGAAAAFMITGPATKITNLGALKIVLGIRRFALYLAHVILFGFVTGLVTNMFYGYWLPCFFHMSTISGSLRHHAAFSL